MRPDAIVVIIRELRAAGISDTIILNAIGKACADELPQEAARPARKYVRRPPGTMDWQQIRQAVIERDGFTCAYCGGPADPLHIDHVHPLSRGGTNDLENLVVACGFCNCSKGSLTVQEWRAKQ